MSSNRAEKSGLSRDIQKKLEAKYSQDQEAQCRAWIEEVLGEKLSNSELGMHNFQQCLRDGQILCKLLNTLNGEPLVKKINQQKMAFKQMENIEQFIKGCKIFGLKDGDIFQTADLYECQNMSQVLANIAAVSSVASSSKGYQGSCIGTKIADHNERDFDEATLNAGKFVLGGQMGFTEGENQSGMSMGKTRKVVDM
ncbi:myophilin-like isoform X3 [Bolinopsis microptera]|uniref:myophilin-like isoform X3 n=1 Tax=Bolinopsis microptera TaxID=2820187 RepID=UPI0030790BBA